MTSSTLNLDLAQHYPAWGSRSHWILGSVQFLLGDLAQTKLYDPPTHPCIPSVSGPPLDGGRSVGREDLRVFSSCIIAFLGWLQIHSYPLARPAAVASMARGLEPVVPLLSAVWCGWFVGPRVPSCR